MTPTDLHSCFLFSPKLISSQVEASLPEGYCLRPLKRNDNEKGILDILGQLSHVGEITQATFQERFDLMQQLKSYYLIVIEYNHQIIACATLFIEYKLLHGCGMAGHIEDVVVHHSQRGQKLGFRLMEQIHGMAKALGCYKVILNCKEQNISFYEKCDFSSSNVQMAHYYDQ
ncbi:glucosamine 6-phosphate N-acetyltransferase [Spinellus fusiger]|nr:glucosamine 6-phosphate N-acetyltransferase [Spinellus fusiger]